MINDDSLNFPLLNRPKRPRIASPDIIFNQNLCYDKYYIVKIIDGSFTNLSPFLIHKALTGYIGELENVRKQKDGSLMVVIKNEKQAEKILSMNTLHTYNVTVEPHKSLNTVRGVISCRDLLNCSEEEILDNLKDQCVTELKRIHTKKDGILIPTSSIILTFKTHSLPDRVKAGWYNLKVRHYIPNPLRCFNCQEFGHVSSKCNKNAICPSCGKVEHKDEPCTPPNYCVNCEGEHSPRYKGCTKFKEEYAIQKIKTINKITYFEAKNKFKSLTPSLNMSFSSATVTGKNKQISLNQSKNIHTSNNNPTSSKNYSSSPSTFVPPPSTSGTHPSSSSTSSHSLTSPFPIPTPPPNHQKPYSAHTQSPTKDRSSNRPLSLKPQPPSIQRSRSNSSLSSTKSDKDSDCKHSRDKDKYYKSFKQSNKK